MVSLSASVLAHARARPRSEALIYGSRRIDYAQLYKETCVAAGLLRAKNSGPGTVVALFMKNSAAFVELALAISHVGAIMLPINYRLGRAEVEYILQHAQASLLFVDEELAEVVTGLGRTVIVPESAQADVTLLAPDLADDVAPYPSRTEDTFRLMYTSGTTDRPKGVIHTYNNYMWKCLDHITTLGLGANDRLFLAGPLYHVGAFDLPGLALLLTGGTLVVLRDFEPTRVLDAIETEALTGGWLAPAMLNRVLLQDVTGRDLSSLKWIVGGGERTPESRIRSFRSVFPSARYIDAYGLTESCSGDTLMEAGREIEKIGSTGRAVPHVAIRICDEDGDVLAAGEVGEICLHGPKITTGYWLDPDTTGKSFHGDWFRTGDMGYLDDEGFLYITDRKKDMIISGGENIASSEVERVLYQIPEILEAAVIGVPDSEWGESVAAVVVLREGCALDLEGLQSRCSGQLGRYKIPRRLFVREALPRNPSGKVLKRVLRDELSEEQL